MAAYTLRQLECFVAVAEHGSIAAAAAELHLSPSAVSGAVNALERSFGTQLTVRRKAHGVGLTPSGRYVLGQARGLLHQAEDLRLHALDAGAELRGTLSLGCYLSLAPTVLARLIDEYTRRHPLVELDFQSAAQRQVQDRVLAGELDVAVLYDMGLPDGIRSQRLYAAAPAVVLSPAHPLAAHPELTFAQLGPEPMILLDVNPSRENTMLMFATAGVEPTVRFRTTDYEVTRSLAARGMGYAILAQQPAADVSYEGRPLAVRPLSPPVRRVGVALVWPDGVRPSRAAAAMLELARELYPAEG